jgi:hypothetical protein
MTTETAVTFRCGVCLNVVSLDEGAADDHPEACGSCWAALTACVKEAERIQHLPLQSDTMPNRSAPVTEEYESGWRDAAAIIVGRLNLIGHHAAEDDGHLGAAWATRLNGWRPDPFVLLVAFYVAVRLAALVYAASGHSVD